MVNRSPLVRCFRWLTSWRGVRRSLIVLAWTATILALLYGEENWRGWRAWSKYRQAAEARGEQLDYTAFIPKPIPDEQNFAATPLIQSWFVNRGNNPNGWRDNFSKIEEMIASPKQDPERWARKFVSLGAWEMASSAEPVDKSNRNQKISSDKFNPESRSKAAPAVLRLFKTNEAAFAELRAAGRRASARYPVKYNLENPWAILLPHLANVKAGCQRLKVKACAELASGQGENALQDVLLGFRLGESIKEEPFLISHLVRIACVQLMIQPIWEGLAEHRWTEAQLQTLQTQLQSYDFVADMKRPLDGEQAAAVLTIEIVRKKGNYSEFMDMAGSEDPLPILPGVTIANMLARIMPRGWYYQEQLNYCRIFQAQLGTSFDITRKRISPGQSAAGERELERIIAGGRLGRNLNALLHHQIAAACLLPALSKISYRASAAQTTTAHAALACALERYRLANGQFPEKLDALAPRFISALPHDVLTGEPYKYRRADPAFVLYSVGWNEKDDGGVPGKVMNDDKQGDWVWEYPRK